MQSSSVPAGCLVRSDRLGAAEGLPNHWLAKLDELCKAYVASGPSPDLGVRFGAKLFAKSLKRCWSGKGFSVCE
jgi:hypothetical protein